MTHYTSISGLDADTAWVVSQNESGSGVWKCHYYLSGGFWGWGYQTYISTGFNPHLSVGSSSAKYLWTDGSGTPYTINMSSETLNKPVDALASQ